MTLKCASDSVDNTDLHCTHLVLLYDKFAVQCPIENIRTGREIHELVTVRFVPNKSIHGSLNRHWGLIEGPTIKRQQCQVVRFSVNNYNLSVNNI